MSKKERPEIGSITWCDLTVPDAESLKDFYSKVIGWIPDPVSMGDYNDYSMTAPESNRVAAGVCHTKGVNSDLPAQWLIYITVEDIDKSIKEVQSNGGKIISGPKKMGGRFCVIQDPAGAVCALFEPE